MLAATILIDYLYFEDDVKKSLRLSTPFPCFSSLRVLANVKTGRSPSNFVKCIAADAIARAS